MNINVKFRLMWVLAFLLAAPWAMAQKDIPVYGFAGEDHTVLNPSHEPRDVYLGLDEIYDNDDSYYEWSLTSAPNDYEEPYYGTISTMINGGNVHVHRLKAVISVPGEYIFQCVRLSKFGYQKDYVVITVTDFAVIKSITNRNKQECWLEGDTITIDQFDITTDPPGVSDLISLAEDSKVAHANSGPNVITGAGEQTLSFLIHSNIGNHVELSDKTHAITVYYDIKHTTSADPILDKIVPKIETLDKLGKRLSERITNKWGDLLGEQPIKIIATVYANPTYYQDCCNGRETNHLSVEVGGVAGIHIEFNVYVLPALLVYVGIEGEITAKPNFTLDFVSDEALRYGCETEGTVQLDVHAEIGGQVGIGTSGNTAAPVALGVKGQVVGAFDMKVVFISSGKENWDFKGVKFSLIVRVIVDYAIGSYTWQYVVKDSGNLGD